MNFSKRNSYLQIISIVLLIGSYVVHAQDPSFVELSGDKEFVFKGGEQKTITLTFMIKEKYHIQGALLDNEFLIPTRLIFKSESGITIDRALFPTPHKFWMTGVAEALDVFSNKLEVRVPIHAEKLITKGKKAVKGSLYFQACDSVKCYYPRTLEFELEIMIK